VRRQILNPVFAPNDIVVHPNHGLGTVRDLVDMEISGRAEQFLVVDFRRTALTVRIPVRSLTQSGLRQVSSKDTMRAALAELPGLPASLSGHWSRWSTVYAEKLNSGKPALLAEILRDLSPTGSSWKAKLHEEALTRLAEELALAEEIELNEARQMIVELLPKDGIASR
jgi:CarD family transcriptional regulator